MTALERFRSRLLTIRDDFHGLDAHVEAEAFIDRLLGELEVAAQESAGELLKLSGAARVSGYTPDHLRALIRAGKLADYGRPHAPRVRRDELPLKPGRHKSRLTTADPVTNLKAQIVGNAIPPMRRRHNG